MLVLNNDNAGSGRSSTVDQDTETRWSQGKRRLLDLDSISFHQGGLLMSNKNCELPQGSFITSYEGYEEVHVPALKAKPYEAGEDIEDIRYAGVGSASFCWDGTAE